MLTATLFHAAFIVNLASSQYPNDSEVAAHSPQGITLEFVLQSDESSSALSLQQPEIYSPNKDNEPTPSAESTSISVGEKYLTQLRSQETKALTKSEEAELESKKGTQTEESFAFERPSTSARVEVERGAADAVAQDANQTEQRIKRAWQKKLVIHLARHRSFPNVAAKQNALVTLNFVLDYSGHITSVTVLNSSGEEAIDQAALLMMHRADPVPPPPRSVAAKGLSFSLPIVFSAGSIRHKIGR